MPLRTRGPEASSNTCQVCSDILPTSAPKRGRTNYHGKRVARDTPQKTREVPLEEPAAGQPPASKRGVSGVWSREDCN